MKSVICLCVIVMLRLCFGQLERAPVEVPTQHYPRPIHMQIPIYIRPDNLINRDDQKQAMPYQFFTDFPQPLIPGNFYIRPDGTVAAVKVETLPLMVTNSGKLQVDRKHHILYAKLENLRKVRQKNE